MTDTKTPLKAFITYSHKNTPQRENFEEFLAVMVQNNEIEIWCDAKLPAQGKWEEAIKTELEKSDILIYLTSAASLASKSCNKELTDVLCKNRNIVIIPVILKDCDFLKHQTLAQFDALPTKNKRITPISKWNPRDAGWQNVVDGIRKKIADKSIPLGNIFLSSTSQETLDTIWKAKRAEAKILFNSANFFLMLCNYDAAIRGYTESLEMIETAPAFNNRGNAYWGKGENDKSITDYSKAIALNSNFAVAYNNRGNAYCLGKEYNKAIADYDKSIDLNPDCAETYVTRGIAYGEIGEYNKSIADCDKAIAIDPNLIEAHNLMGDTYSNKDAIEESIAAYSKAIELAPNAAYAYKQRAVVCDKKGELDKSIADYTKVIELIPDNIQAYNSRGVAKSESQDYKGAKQDFRTALKLAELHGNKPLAARIQKKIDLIPADNDE